MTPFRTVPAALTVFQSRSWWMAETFGESGRIARLKLLFR